MSHAEDVRTEMQVLISRFILGVPGFNNEVIIFQLRVHDNFPKFNGSIFDQFEKAGAKNSLFSGKCLQKNSHANLQY